MTDRQQNIIFTNHVGQALDTLIGEKTPKGGLFIISDENTTDNVVAPLLATAPLLKEHLTSEIVIPPGDTHKDIETLYNVWGSLSDEGATRNALVINIGGGMVTDLGGFAAATFKRGVRFINVPTTLLGAVDAAVGGKTGINIGNLKNEVGAFAPAEAVVISTVFFNTLDRRQLLSGFAEMVKHGFISGNETVNNLLNFDIDKIASDSFLDILADNVNVKRDIVLQDPTEKGLRKALNFGHTAGHAFETLSLERGTPVTHGYAVAWGMLTELALSHLRHQFPSDIIYRYASFLKENYGVPDISCDDYDRLISLMGHDKKNPVEGEINFTLLASPGKPITDCIVSTEEIKGALDITRAVLGI